MAGSKPTRSELDEMIQRSSLGRGRVVFPLMNHNKHQITKKKIKNKK